MISQKKAQELINKYELKPWQLHNASYVQLDGVCIKDRWGVQRFPVGSINTDWSGVEYKVTKQEYDMAEVDVYIGINGHLLYTNGQEGSKKVKQIIKEKEIFRNSQV